MSGEGLRVRLRTISEKRASMQAYDALRRTGRVARALVIAELHDGGFEVLGQGLTPEQIARSLVVAAGALRHHDASRQAPRPEAHEQPVAVGERTGITRGERAIRLDADGIMVPPPGETFISCGACQHPRWYVLHTAADDVPARIACSHCGNEVVMIRVQHEGGRA